MLEVQTVDTNDFTKNFRRRKSDEMSQGVLWTQLMLQAVQLTFPGSIPTAKHRNVHEVIHDDVEQKMDEQVMVQ